MEKLIILSIVFVSLGLPAWLATSTRPKKALRQAQWAVLFYVIVWGYLCLHVYPQLVQIK
ncbi:MAG: hypothetical protein ABSE49_02310 [Polyangiaceae bacterium]|jgi:cytochrome c biogenesis protein CcdA